MISPWPCAPGPARSQRDMTCCAMDGGKPRRLAGSPVAAATSRCASANLVMESASIKTWAPWSRKYSATVIIVCAARARVSADRSDVAATTTERAKPSGPSVSSKKSRTSRPRSPINPMTTTSAVTPRARRDKSCDFPTPEPAKRPMRCPCTIGKTVSKAARPVSSRRPNPRRSVGGGGAA